MSIKIMTWVWENSPTNGSVLLVHLALADFANDEGYCWPSLETIGTKARISKRQAIRAIKELEQKKLVEKEKQYTEKDGKVVYTSSLYRVVTGCHKGSDMGDTRGSDMGDTRVVTPMSLKPSINHQLEPSLIIDLEEARAYYFDIFGRKRWANKRQEEYFTDMLERHGRETLIRAIDWAALKNISDLARIDKAAETMNKKPKGELRREGMGIQL